MLPKKERLTKKDFLETRPKVVFRGVLADVSFLPKVTEISRFSCVIAKKRVKKAHDRNFLKRKFYHLLRNYSLKTPHLVVVYPKEAAVSASFTEIDNEMCSFFDTLH